MHYKTTKILKDSYYKRNRNTILSDSYHGRKIIKRNSVKLFFDNIDRMEKKNNAFWSMFKKIDDCLIWTGSNVNGYGGYRFDGKFQVVHRRIYELKIGKIPNGYVLHHKCGHTLCANVDHLELTTQKKNLSHVPPATSCRKGHEFTEDNTYVSPVGARGCRTCRKENRKRHKEKSLGILKNNS